MTVVVIMMTKWEDMSDNPVKKEKLKNHTTTARNNHFFERWEKEWENTINNIVDDAYNNTTIQLQKRERELRPYSVLLITTTYSITRCAAVQPCFGVSLAVPVKG